MTLQDKVRVARVEARRMAKRERYKLWRKHFLAGRTYSSIARTFGVSTTTVMNGVLAVSQEPRDELNRLHRAAVRAKHAAMLAKQKARAEVRAGWETTVE